MILQVQFVPSGLEGLGQAFQQLGAGLGAHFGREGRRGRELAEDPELQQQVVDQAFQLQQALQRATAGVEEPIQTEFGEAPAAKGVDPEDAKILAAQKIAEASDFNPEDVLETIESREPSVQVQAQAVAEKRLRENRDITLADLIAEEIITARDLNVAEAGAGQAEAFVREEVAKLSTEMGLPENQVSAQVLKATQAGLTAEQGIETMRRWNEIVQALPEAQKVIADLSADPRGNRFLNNIFQQKALDIRAQANAIRARALALRKRETGSLTPQELLKFKSDQFALMTDMQEGIDTQLDRLREIEAGEGEAIEGERRLSIEHLNGQLRVFKNAADQGLIPVDQAENFIAEVRDRPGLPDRLEFQVFLPGLEDEEVKENARIAKERALDNFENVGAVHARFEQAARFDETHFWNALTPEQKQFFLDDIELSLNPPRDPIEASERGQRALQGPGPMNRLMEKIGVFFEGQTVTPGQIERLQFNR